MDVTTQPGDADGMNTTQKIAVLLAQARDITRDTLGSLPPPVVAEVFRALYLEAGEMTDQGDDADKSLPHVVH